jgi:hypothetical protein
MFVIQLESGKTRGFATAHELGSAIRRGELGPESRIYHRATDRWLPLTIHPEYRRAAAEREQSIAKELLRRHWTFLPREGSTDEISSPPSAPPSSPTPAPAQESSKRTWLGSTLRRLRHRQHPTADQS